VHLRPPRPGETFEIEDPPDQLGLLSDPNQVVSTEPAQAVPVFPLTEGLHDQASGSVRMAAALRSTGRPGRLESTLVSANLIEQRVPDISEGTATSC
jgi:hypothetical protein